MAEESSTSLVLTLTSTGSLPADVHQAWSNLPRASDKDARSLTAVAQLLTKLRIPLPRLPRLYNQCDSIRPQLHDRLAQLETTATQLPSTWQADMDSAVSEGRTAQYLLHNADMIAAATEDNVRLTQWLDVLTPHTSCMSRGPARPPAAAAAGAQRDGNTRRCVLRLDFASTLVWWCVGMHLTHLTQPVAGLQCERLEGARQPLATATVQRYKRRLITARVAGFAVGPLQYDPTSCFTSTSELHGNWQVLRDWLIQATPHCTPAAKPVILNRGVGEVEFVLEETHLDELLALNGRVDPANGITRPLRTTVRVRKESTSTACSTCGQANHKARTCTAQLPPGTRTCKACFFADHTTEHCPTSPEQRQCSLCSQHGHSTMQCKKYWPVWVEVATPKRPAQQRNTFAVDRVALMQGRARPQQPVPTVQQPAAQRDSQSAGRRQGRADAGRSWADTVRVSAEAGRGPADTTSRPHTAQGSQQPTQLEHQIATLVQRMDEQQQKWDKQMEWMMQMMGQMFAWITGQQPAAPCSKHPALHKQPPAGYLEGDGDTAPYSGQFSLSATAAPAITQPAQAPVPTPQQSPGSDEHSSASHSLAGSSRAVVTQRRAQCDDHAATVSPASNTSNMFSFTAHRDTNVNIHTSPTAHHSASPPASTPHNLMQPNQPPAYSNNSGAPAISTSSNEQ